MKRRKEKEISTTIIKRSSRRDHGGIHGGAWKVAFADFTLAMMCLFMVLWIVNSVSQPERKAIISSIYGISSISASRVHPFVSSHTGSGNSLVQGGSIPGISRPQQESTSIEAQLREQGIAQNHRITSLFEDENVRNKLVLSSSKEDKYPPSSASAALPPPGLGELTQLIQKITEENHAQANISMEVIPEGVRILLQDANHQQMFSRGSAHLTPFFNKLLVKMGPIFEKTHNKIIITGHTDAARYRENANYNNWNLSSDRSIAAKIALESGGLDDSHILQVAGMADNALFDKAHPLGEYNRRIEITVLTQQSADILEQLFESKGKPLATQHYNTAVEQHNDNEQIIQQEQIVQPTHINTVLPQVPANTVLPQAPANTVLPKVMTNRV